MAKSAKDDGACPRARQLLEEVVRDDPSYSSARVLLAVVYHRLRLRRKSRRTGAGCPPPRGRSAERPARAVYTE